MIKDRYIFPAIFDYVEDGISVEFPDLQGCLTFGNDDQEALSMEREAMALHLYGIEEDNEQIPTPTKATSLKPKPNKVVVLVEAWMPPFRNEMKNKAVKKTLTIPQWLDDLAKEHKVNYSQLLQEALKKYLGAEEPKKRA
jgi:predicted RNase H-like HicB family nuclease